MKKLLMILGFCVLAATCVLTSLERKLDKDMRAWLRGHAILMQTDVPAFVAGKEGVSEYAYFLNLQPGQQVRYKEMFWKIREKEARPVFESRMEYVRRHMRDFGRSSMSELILLCGLPDQVEVFGPKGAWIGMGDILDDKGYGQVIAVWSYWKDSYRVDYGFESKGSAWYVYPLGVEAMSYQTRFEKSWREFFAPTWNGWDEWLAVIGNDKPVVR